MPENSHPIADKAMDLLLDTVCVVDGDGVFVFVSASCKQLLGYTPEELTGRNMLDLVLPEDRELTLQVAAQIMGGQAQQHFENRYIRKDGRIVDIMWSARWSEAYGVRLAVARDITELKRTTRMQKALYQISEAGHNADGLPVLFERLHQITDTLLPAPDFCIALYDSGADTLTFPYRVVERKRIEESVTPRLLIESSPLGNVLRSGLAKLATQQREAGETGLYATTQASGFNWLAVPLTSTRATVGALILQSPSGGLPFTADDKELLQFVATPIANAIERKLDEARLRHMASHDALTDLPNRVLFNDRLDMALKLARRNNENLALLYLDLDGFKHINDSCGHAVGDLLLCEIARRLGTCVRSSDTVARLGGDEFTVLLTAMRDGAIADSVVAKIHQVLSEPFALAGRTISITASIGTAVYPDHGAASDELFHYADARMYAIKAQRKTGFAEPGAA